MKKMTWRNLDWIQHRVPDGKDEQGFNKNKFIYPKHKYPVLAIVESFTSKKAKYSLLSYNKAASDHDWEVDGCEMNPAFNVEYYSDSEFFVDELKDATSVLKKLRKNQNEN